MVTSGRASFTTMVESTAEDWAIISEARRACTEGVADRVLAELEATRGLFGGLGVDHLTHCLQTATRAERAGRSDQYVFCALLHDVGDALGPYSHAAVGAAIVRPFVTPDLHWMVEHHDVFQGYYFFHHLGMDRHARDEHAGHPWYDLTAEFCAEFDQTSFDPAYETEPIEHFEPLVRAVVASPLGDLTTVGGPERLAAGDDDA